MSKVGRVTGLLLLAAFMLLSLPTGALSAPNVIPGEFLVKFKSTALAADRMSARARVSAISQNRFDIIRIEHWKAPGMTAQQVLDQLGGDQSIEYVEPVYEIRLDAVPNDPRFPEMWQLRNTGQTGGTVGADIRATQAWDLFTGDPNVKIGVIDTGVDYNHPDLAANVWTNPGEIPGNGIDDDGNGYIDDVHGYDVVNSDGDPFDDNGHGTHCSGTIAALGNNNTGTVGINWQAKIVGIKFLNASGSGSTAGAIAGINYAIAAGVRLTSNSWGGGGFSQALLDAINAAGAAGQLFIAAAGNASSNTDVSPNYPSCYDTPYIIAVASTDLNDNLSSFSNYGATTVDIAAPGSDILSTLPGNSYGLLSGTSMATPHVSGVAGLAWGRYPALTNLQVKTMILNAADYRASLQGKCVTNGRLNAFMTIAEPDTTPPGGITDLAASGPGSNSIRLTWTATGDDGTVGRASSYEIRYSESPITEETFPSAVLVVGPDPLPAGSPESFEVTGLNFLTTYYFAIMAFDEFSNAGPMSNLASGTTLGIPDIAANPLSFSSTLLTGDTDSQALTLSNQGEGTLDFTIPQPELLLSQPPPAYECVPVAKGEDNRTGDPVTLGQGGPDSFGYRWVDSDEPTGPVFDWMDIAGIGTPVALTGDDATSGVISMGMDFPFYGNTYNSLRVCTNGFLSFTDAATSYGNQLLPNSGAPANLVAPFWDDLNFGTVQHAYTYYDGARFIVSWVAVPAYSGGGPYTFQVILYPTGELRYQYLDMVAPVNSATTGIQNDTKTIGLNVAFNTNWVHNGLAVRLIPLRQWLSVSPASGRILAGQSQTVAVNFDAATLTGGTYTANIHVLSNDPDGSPLILPATLHVTGAPDIAVNPTSFDFGEVFAGAILTRTLTISNPGTDNLDVTALVSGDPTVTTDFVPLTLPPRGAQNVTVRWQPPAPMALSASLEILSNDPDTPTLLVPLAGQAVPAPNVSVAPTAFSETLLTNTAVTRNLRVTNGGGSNYAFTAQAVINAPTGTVIVQGDADNVFIDKDQPDIQFGLTPMRAGGPDGFGYTYKDSDETGGPSFNWVDISAVGTQINMTGDDTNTGPYPIGFNFPFYGNTFGTFRVSTNGFVSFTSTATSYSNTTLPNTGSTVPENLLAVLWDDMTFSTVKRAYYYNDGTRLIIEYLAVPRYGDTSNPNTFEIILYPNGTVIYQYLDIRAATKNSLTIGMQNQAKNDGLQVAYNALYVKNNLAIRFQPPARFLTVTPPSGTILPGGFVDLSVGFNAGGLMGGLYDGAVRLTGNDPVLPVLDVPAQLTVIGVPDIAASPASVAFGNVFVGYPRLRQLSVLNTGTDNLVVGNITSSDPAYGVDQTSFTVPALGSALLTVSFSPPSPGSFPAHLTINSNDPDTPALLVPLDGVGLIPPDIGTTPGALASTLYIPASETRQLTIENSGGSDLNFVIGARVTPTSVPVYQEVVLGKEETDPRVGLLGSGGPDVFGYTWRDSDEPGGPIFDWVDITSIGYVLPVTGDDQTVTAVPIGFDFPFYGNTFSTINVCSNGWLSFTNTTTSLSNQPLPNSGSGVPENLLAAFWDDLNASPGNHVYAYRDGTRMIISYVAIPRYSSGGPYTFQVILYPSGKIVYQYLDMQGTRLNEATIGIQNAARDDGLTVVYNANYAHDGLAVEFHTVPDWLTASPSTGTIPAGGSAMIDVLFDSQGLFGRVYEGAVQITSNDPDEGVVVVPATLTAIGTPDIAVAPASLDFGTIYVGQSVDLTVQVRNIGSDVLDVTGASVSNPAFQLLDGVFPLTLGDRGSQTLTVRFTPTGECIPCQGSLVLVSNDPDMPQLAVPLSGVGLIPPEIDLQPPALRAALATTLGPTAIMQTKPLRILNTGGSDLRWTAEALAMLPAAVSTPSGETGKDQKGTSGEPTVLAFGGPDAFGYRWADSDDPVQGVPFAWVDITGPGTLLPVNGDDQNVGPFALPFPFPFYGNIFSTFQVCSNGWLSFTNTTTSLSNYTLPNTGAPENLLAPFWDDLDLRSAGSVYSYYDGAKFILSYVNVPRYSSGGPYTFQVLLYPSGTIDFQYLSMAGTRLNEATIGIQNGTKDVGLQVVYNAAYVKDNLRIRFSRLPGWLSVTPVSGVVPAGQEAVVSVKFDATGLADGDYSGVVRVASNDLDEPLVTVPCDLHVGVVPGAFEMTPNTLNRRSNGNWVQGKITPPVGYGPTQIRTSSVLVQRVVPVAPGAPVSYEGGQAHYKFDRQGVMDALPNGNSVPVEVIGEVDGMTWFAATDYVRVQGPRVNGPSGQTSGGSTPMVFSSWSRVPLEWLDPEGATASYFELWYSTNGGESWTLADGHINARSTVWTVPGEPTESGLLELVAVDDLGVMGSWISDPFQITTSPAAVEDPLPVQCELRVTSGNPARSSATLEFGLPAPGAVDINVYDVRGALVRQLAGGSFGAGRHALAWDGTNGAGRRVGAGVYLVRLISGDESRTVRLHLLP